MPTVKKLRFANGVNIEAPEDLSLETATNTLPVFVDDAEYAAEYDVIEGSIYLNTNLKAPRLYLGGVWRTGIMQQDAADATKTVSFDLTGCSAGADNVLDFNSTVDRTYTFPDVSATVVLTLGAQELEDKTIKNGFLDGTKIRNNALDVEAAGALTVGASMGANTMTLGGATSTVSIPGNLTVSGTTTTVDTVNLDVKDKNILVNKGGNDAGSEGSGLTIDRTGTKWSLIYKASANSKFASGDLGSEKNIAAIDDITASNLTGIVPASKGGTGINNNDAATLTRTGNFDLNITTTAASAVTMPTTGTLATLNGSETLLNKAISSTAAVTGALQLPAGNNTQRPSGVDGMIRYNNESGTFEGYKGAAWSGIGGGGGGTVFTIVAANSFVIGDVVYYDGTSYVKAIASAANTAEVIGMISAASPTQFDITMVGEVAKTEWGLTPGEAYFLSATTAGLVVTTEPSTIGQVSVPIGVASSSTKMYVSPKRGAVVGGTNARAQVSLTSGAVTNVQNVGTMDAGELTGWVFISSAAPVRFYVSSKFAKSGAGGDYNLSYSTTGDTPPVGFLVDITTTGMIRVTLPASSGSTSVINYALNAPAIGASFPLTVDAGTILSGTVGAARLPAPSAYSDAEATRMGLKIYRAGVAYNGGNTITATGTTGITYSSFIPYQMQDGTWRLKINITSNTSAATTTSVVFSSISAISASQALSVGNYGTGFGGTLDNTGGLRLNGYAPTSVTSWYMSADIELASKPAWAY
jgi:hypothetical protein